MGDINSNTSEKNDNQEKDEKINDVMALSQLVSVIVDYYSFKNGVQESEEGDEWKQGVRGENGDLIVPSKIDSIIEKAFTAQLKRFAVQNVNGTQNGV